MPSGYEIGVRAQLSTVQRHNQHVRPDPRRPLGWAISSRVQFQCASRQDPDDASFAGIAYEMPDGKGKLVGML